MASNMKEALYAYYMEQRYILVIRTVGKTFYGVMIKRVISGETPGIIVNDLAETYLEHFIPFSAILSVSVTKL